MGNIEDALKILEADRIKNASIINFIKNNKVLSIDIIREAVLARGVSDRRWVYISCPDRDDLTHVISHLNPDDKSFGAIEDWMVPFLTERKEIDWDIAATRFYLPDAIQIPPYEKKAVQLTENDALTVYNTSEYKEYISPEYTSERIQKGITAGIFDDNKLVSWAITQDDGAIGFLHTVEEYRRKGYAYIVTLSMIDKLRSMGELPFAYVVASNVRSISLLQKLGFMNDNIFHWFIVE